MFSLGGLGFLIHVLSMCSMVYMQGGEPPWYMEVIDSHQMHCYWYG